MCEDGNPENLGFCSEIQKRVQRIQTHYGLCI